MSDLEDALRRISELEAENLSLKQKLKTAQRATAMRIKAERAILRPTPNEAAVQQHDITRRTLPPPKQEGFQA